MRISKRLLIILAALVWYIGGIMLFRSGLELIRKSGEIRPDAPWHWLAIGLGIVLGVIQAATIFSRSCKKNLTRIHNLEDPKIWQFFRPGFFLALGVMITTGVLLDHWSQGQYFFMLGVAALDFALTLSLFGSSIHFWTWKSTRENGNIG
jgi:hypothetical protein